MASENGRGNDGLSEILARTQQNRLIVQDYRPLADSLEWQLGQHSYQRRGNKGFVADDRPIPFVVNNNGGLSAKAAELLFTALSESEKKGTLEERVFVLELGIGVGLFARMFLDSFRDRCDREGKDYYERLCYVAADRSEKMLIDACRHGIFADHPGRYVLRVLDADGPLTSLLADIAVHDLAPAPIRAVFLNYVLDCLPAAHLQIDDRGVRQLYIRTYLARAVDLQERTHLTSEEIVRLAGAGDPGSLDALAPLYGLFASEYDYREVDAGSLPFGEMAVGIARGKFQYTLHNYGALRCLTRLAGLTRDDGFILANDYGSAKLEDYQEPSGPQRFSESSAIGLNFTLMAECLEQSEVTGWITPEEDEGGLIARMLVKEKDPQLIDRFRDLFGKKRFEESAEPLRTAREYFEQGRHELVLGAYEEALREQPSNWYLMGEVARFLALTLRDPNAGLLLTRAALRVNRCCSSDLWNDLGECLYLLERRTEGQQAFQRALLVNPSDPRAYFNLAVNYYVERDFPASLRMIAEGLALDNGGSFTQKLLKVQETVVELLARLRQFETKLHLDRVSHVVDRATRTA